MKPVHYLLWPVKFFYLFIIVTLRLKMISFSNTFKQRIHNLFVATVGIILILWFMPWRKNQIVLDHHDSLLFFLFGITTLLNVDYIGIVSDRPHEAVTH
jgi:hypothetical protein